MALVLLTLAMDEDDPALAFATRWVGALARRFDRVHVITMRAGRAATSSNVRVYSAGKELGYGEAHRVLVFYRHLRNILRNDRIEACFAHMNPAFAVLAAPVLRLRHVPIVTWHAHPALTWRLRLAHHLSSRMVTSIASAYPYRHDRLLVIGQGIDTELFAPGSEAPEDPPVILCVGRLSPVKEHPVLLRAASHLRRHWPQPFRVVFLGGPLGARDGPYVESLRAQVTALGLQDAVQFEPPVPLADLPSWYRRCAVHVNLTRTGSGDKVALEAMSCGRPSVLANEGFQETLGAHATRLFFRAGDSEDLAGRLKEVLAASREDRDGMGRDLREQVLRHHSLEGLAERLTGILRAEAARS